MAPLISVVIPTRRHESFAVTAASLMDQTFQDFEVITIVDTELKGQSWARNQGISMARGQYTLFSDSDIEWRANAIETLLRTLTYAVPAPLFKVGYAYGGYELYQRVFGAFGAPHREILDTVCMRPWQWDDLLHYPYISTMSLVQTDLCRRYPFREELRRLEDWALWIELGLAGFCGAWCEEVIFSTRLRSGISHDGPIDHATAEQYMRSLLKL